MKLGIISDVHSNIEALEMVFDVFEKEKVEKIICVGDVIGIGPYPEKCMNFLMERQNKFVSYIKGNHENYLLKGAPKRNHNEENGRILTEYERSMHLWNQSRLDESQVEFIRNLKDRDVIEIEGKKIVIEHYPMDKNNKFKKYKNVPTEQEIEDMFEEKDADIYFFGHTHIKYYCEIKNRKYINPGSAGCPLRTNAACCGILKIENGQVDYEQLDINYDIDKMVNAMKELHYPLYDNMIREFYGREA